MEATPGWYGKLPSTGDFASRRLPHELIEPWDNWLAEELAGLKAQSDDWLNAYLDSPTWRFVVPARWVHAGQAGLLAGVLMPSVDSVGRYFPLSIMATLPEMPSHPGALEPVLNWLHALDDLAADALQEDWPIDTLEGALARLPVPRPDPLAVSGMSPLLSGDRRMVSIPVPDTRQALMGGIGQALLQWVLGQSGGPAPDLGWWWCEPHAMVQQRQLLVTSGLPCGPDFATLLGSNHNRHAVPASVMPPTVHASSLDQTIPLVVSGVAFMASGALGPEASDETVPPLSSALMPPSSAHAMQATHAAVSATAPSAGPSAGSTTATPIAQDDSDATLPPAPRVQPTVPDTTQENASDDTPAATPGDVIASPGDMPLVTADATNTDSTANTPEDPAEATEAAPGTEVSAEASATTADTEAGPDHTPSDDTSADDTLPATPIAVADAVMAAEAAVAEPADAPLPDEAASDTASSPGTNTGTNTNTDTPDPDQTLPHADGAP